MYKFIMYKSLHYFIYIYFRTLFNVCPAWLQCRLYHVKFRTTDDHKKEDEICTQCGNGLHH